MKRSVLARHKRKQCARPTADDYDYDAYAGWRWRSAHAHTHTHNVPAARTISKKPISMRLLSLLPKSASRLFLSFTCFATTFLRLSFFVHFISSPTTLVRRNLLHCYEWQCWMNGWLVRSARHPLPFHAAPRPLSMQFMLGSRAPRKTIIKYRISSLENSI